MRKIAFHSYKGGSGRTLALANMATALQATGRRVLLIDFDFDAPGLAYKLNVSSQVSGGYIAYLHATSADVRANLRNRESRIERLQHDMIEIRSTDLQIRSSKEGRPLQLLPAGNPEQEEYWIQLGSDKLQDLFAFGLAKPRRQITDLASHVSWKAFLQDIKDIEEAAGNPDFCLIDCRSIRDTVSPALWGWADHVVEFFHCNLEGVLGLHLLQERLNSEPASADRQLDFTPVVTRLPNHMQVDQIKDKIRALAKNLQPDPTSGVVELPLQNLQVLPEQQAVEVGDLLVLSETRRSTHSLSHDYVGLFARITGSTENNARNRLRDGFDLDRSQEIADRMFGLDRSKGSLVNSDGEENVALRKTTLTILVNSVLGGLYEGVDATTKTKNDDRVRRVFGDAGLKVGRSFGLETTENPNMWRNGVRPDNVEDRLTQWCEFDGQAGLGRWSAEWDPKGSVAILTLLNHFLDAVDHDFGLPFLLGYLQGVLEHVLAETGTVEVAFSRGEGTGMPREFRFTRKE